MTVFDTALRTLHADANLGQAAIWRAGGKGPGVSVRVVRGVVDEDTLVMQDVAVRRDMLHVAVSAAAEVQKDDSFTILDSNGSEIERVVVTASHLDPAGVTWVCNIRRM